MKYGTHLSFIAAYPRVSGKNKETGRRTRLLLFFAYQS